MHPLIHALVLVPLFGALAACVSRPDAQGIWRVARDAWATDKPAA